jgi:hypothetical protein
VSIYLCYRFSEVVNDGHSSGAIVRQIGNIGCHLQMSINPRTTHAGLAIEIWLKIFQYATYIPDALDLIPINAFIPQQPSNNALGPTTYVLSM